MKSFVKILISIQLLFLTVGFVGFFTSYELIFKGLSIYNLLLTFILVSISFYTEMPQFLKTFGLVFLLGFTAEQIGVHSGLLFGNYSYSNHLGMSFYDVPLIIGINWSILSIGAWHICKKLHRNRWVNIFAASLLMVLFDIVMEPTAIDLNYWKWTNGSIPMYNYVSWFLISLPAVFICSKFQTEYSGISKTVFISQSIFFAFLSFKIVWL